MTACGGTSNPANPVTNVDQPAGQLPSPPLQRDETPLAPSPDPVAPVDDEPPAADPSEPEPQPEPMVFVPEPTPEIALLEQLNADIATFNARADAINFPDLEFTPDNLVPTAGTAEFDGFIEIEANPSDMFSASMALDLDFANMTFTAEHGEFLRSELFSSTGPRIYSGDLSLRGGTIGFSDDPNRLQLTISGTLVNRDGGASRLHLAGRVNGSLIGDDLVGLGLTSPTFADPDVITIRVDDETQYSFASINISALASE